MSFNIVNQETGDISEVAGTGVPFPSRQAIDASPYARIGADFGLPPGIIRRYNQINKIVVIGNSMTRSGYADFWQVSDNREGAATYPTSGWVHLIYDYLRENIYPGIKVYKIQGNVWEHQTEGSRNGNVLTTQPVYELTPEGQEEMVGVTADDILTRDTDVVICQLYENMGVTSGYDFTKDFENLYDWFRERCPYAKLLQFCGVWQVLQKTWCVLDACNTRGVSPVVCPDFFPAPLDNQSNKINHEVGDPIYDGDGHVITTVSETFRTHPTNWAFKRMAGYTMLALFNDVSFHFQNRPHLEWYYKTKSGSGEKYEHPFDEPVAFTEITARGDNSSNVTALSDWNALYSTWLSYFILPGRYQLSLLTAQNQPTRGTFITEDWITDYDAQQEYIVSGGGEFATNGDERFVRRHLLGAFDMPPFSKWLNGTFTGAQS